MEKELKKLKPNPEFQQVIRATIDQIMGDENSPGAMGRPGFPQIMGAGGEGPSLLAALGDFGIQLANMYDDLTAKGLLIRMGRVSLMTIRMRYPQISNLGSLENRLKPIDRRFTDSLEAVAEWLSQVFGLNIESEKEESMQYRMLFPPVERDQSYALFFIFGFLEEFCTWLDARKAYRLTFQESEASTHPAMDIAIVEPE